MHCEKNIDKAYAVTCGLGFDLICDFSGSSLETNRRSIIKMLAIFGRIITRSGRMQLDPPETALLGLLNAQINFLASTDTFIESALYDGIIRSIVEEVIEKFQKS